MKVPIFIRGRAAAAPFVPRSGRSRGARRTGRPEWECTFKNPKKRGKSVRLAVVLSGVVGGVERVLQGDKVFPRLKRVEHRLLGLELFG